MLVYTVVLAAVVRKLPQDKIWSDLVLAGFFIMTDVQRFFIGTQTQLGFQTFMVLSFLGVHTYAIMVYFVSLVVIEWNLNLMFACFTGLMGLGLLTLSGTVEFRVAALLLDLQRKNTVTETLLDHAT